MSMGVKRLPVNTLVWPSAGVTHTALSPAKINLFLHVVGRRANGYHELQSLFCPLAWGDEVQLSLGVQPSAPPGVEQQSPHPGWVFLRSGDLLHIPAEQDLAWRAALAMVRELPAPPHPLYLHIGVQKRIPMQAGLGGGSSNAATVLRCLNQALGKPLPWQDLAALALPLGADVPFFIGGSPAWVEGVGEQVQPVALPAAQAGAPWAWALVYNPPMPCPTATVFAHPGLVRNTPRVSWPFAALGAAGLHAVCDWLRACTTNALQAVVAQTTAGWQEEFEQFAAMCAQHGALLVRMSGSGSAMFALFPDAHRGQQAWVAGRALPLLGQWQLCGVA